MRALIAFDKFKDSLTSPEACAIATRALRAARPDWEIDPCPLTDGGEGFAEILTRAAGGEMRSFVVAGPRGQPVSAPVGFIPAAQIPPAARRFLPAANSAAPLAVIEMARASGLAQLEPAARDPWQTSSIGTGELIRAAAEAGAAAILLGVGGSATNDLGLGALAALGLEFLGASGQPITPPIPARWAEIIRLQGRPRPVPPIYIACDVTNPLLGPTGAAAVYGPQKGLRPDGLRALEHASARLGLLLLHHCGQRDALMDTPGAGAAGGISFGLMTAMDARLLPGFDLVSAWLDLGPRLAAADIVITGEGRFDQSSLDGKGPGAIAAQALAAGKSVHVFAGAVAAMPPRAQLALHAITPDGTPLPEALRQGSTNLEQKIAAVFTAAHHAGAKSTRPA